MRTGRIEREWGAEALQPTVGWKVWRVEDGTLLSVLYGDRWPVDEPVRATCRRHVHVAHDAPALGCDTKTIDNALQRVKRKVLAHQQSRQVLQ